MIRVILSVFAASFAVSEGLPLKLSSEVAVDTPTPSPLPEPISTVKKLSNGIEFPLVGIGVGNLAHNQIPDVLSEALSSKFRLIDTTSASKNEALISEAIKLHANKSESSMRGRLSAIKDTFRKPELEEIHVVTKVWYTHLGYERTKLSVQRSLSALEPKPKPGARLKPKKNNLKVHILLHWPRCDDNVKWMHCEDEENALDESVKSIGSSPLLDKQNAWKDSWRALEDMYEEGKIHSIGVSNFDISDMHELLDICKITPHIYQGNMWTAMFDPNLMNLLRDNGIYLQAYNVMEGVVTRREAAPLAYASLEGIAESHQYSVSRLVLRNLVQHGIGVIPQTSSKLHLNDNSPKAIGSISKITSLEDKDVEAAINTLFRGEDLESSKDGDDGDSGASNHGVHVTFFNSLSFPARVFSVNDETSEEIFNIIVEPGVTSKQVTTSPGHVYEVYDENGGKIKTFQVTADHDAKEEFRIELDNATNKTQETNLSAHISEGDLSNLMVHVTFENTLSLRVGVFWIDDKTNEEVFTTTIEPGTKSQTQNSFPGHTFLVVDEHGEKVNKFQVTDQHGGEEEFRVEIDDTNKSMQRDNLSAQMVSVSFVNHVPSPVKLFWIKDDGGGEEVLIGNIEPEHRARQNSQPGHTFVAYNEDDEFIKHFRVSADSGEEEIFYITSDIRSSNHRVNLSFVNSLTSIVSLVWVHRETGENISVVDAFLPGDTRKEFAHPGQIFIAYDENGKKLKTFEVNAENGGEENFHIEL